jgi:hypothetical protein
MNLDDLAHFTLKEWTRMSIAPTSVEVERAKSQLKAALLLGLDGTTTVAEDIGRQFVTTGKRFSPLQIESVVDAVTVDDIKRVAQKYLWDRDVCIFPMSWTFFLTVTTYYRSLLPLWEVSTVFWTIIAFVMTCRPCFTRWVSKFFGRAFDSTNSVID